MKWIVSLLVFSVIQLGFGAPIGLPDVDEDVIGYEDFLKDVVMAAEPRRVRRKPVEEIVGKTVVDLLSGRLPEEELDRVRRDGGEQMLIMGSPFSRGSSDCEGTQPKDSELPTSDYYQNYPTYQGIPYNDYRVPISMPYLEPVVIPYQQPLVPASLPYQQQSVSASLPYQPQSAPDALPYQQPETEKDQQEESYITESIPPKVYKGKTVGAGLGIPLADGGSAVTHTGNLGGLGLPGLAGLGGAGLAGGGLGAAGLSGLTAGIGVSAISHGHKGHGSIAVPIGHEPAYITSIPFISGYELKPIYSMKKVVVKEIGKEHVLHKGLGLSGFPGYPGLPGLAARSAVDPSNQFYIDEPEDQNSYYQIQSLPGPEGRSSSAEDTSKSNNFYVDGPGDHHPLDLNIFFVDPMQAKEASEPELLSPETYSDAIRTLQQQIDHLQSLKLAQEQRTQTDEINCV